MVDKCQLLGGNFASFIQFALAALSIATLIIKREQEVPRRDWYVWFLDVMKQGLGAAFGHFANIYLSMIIANSLKDGTSDECQWYCLTYVGDSILGTLLNILLLQAFEKLLFYCPQYYFLFNNGDYGNPPQLSIWFPQLCIWLIIVILSKILLLGGLYQFLIPLDRIMSYVFRIVQDNPKFELVLVMVIIPSILNTLQFWVTDTFLKRQDDEVSHHHHHVLEVEDVLSDGELDDVLMDEEASSGGEKKESNKSKQRLQRIKEKKKLQSQRSHTGIHGTASGGTPSSSGLGSGITYLTNMTVGYAKSLYRVTGLTLLWKRFSGKADNIPSLSQSQSQSLSLSQSGSTSPSSSIAVSSAASTPPSSSSSIASVIGTAASLSRIRSSSGNSTHSNSNSNSNGGIALIPLSSTNNTTTTTITATANGRIRTTTTTSSNISSVSQDDVTGTTLPMLLHDGGNGNGNNTGSGAHRRLPAHHHARRPVRLGIALPTEDTDILRDGGRHNKRSPSTLRSASLEFDEEEEYGASEEDKLVVHSL